MAGADAGLSARDPGRFRGLPRMAILATTDDANTTREFSADVEQRLQSRDRMASIGTLAAGVVHGINNPLSYVIANLEYVRRIVAQASGKLEGQALHEFAEVLDDSLDGAERVRRIVSDIGSFSRPLERARCQ